MENIDIGKVIWGAVTGGLWWFLRETMLRLKAMEEKQQQTEVKVQVLDSEMKSKHSYLSEKIEDMNIAIKDLTMEVKALLKEMRNNK